MGVGLPAHLSATHSLALRRSSGGGLDGWKSPQGDIAPYWEGEGYVSFPRSEAVANVEGGRRTGHALFYFEVPEGGHLPKASDKLIADGIELEVIAVRPANSLIDFWKIDLKTGTS